MIAGRSVGLETIATINGAISGGRPKEYWQPRHGLYVKKCAELASGLRR